MISAGEPQVFFPFGLEYLNHHPKDVYLPAEVTPAASSASSLDFSHDLLRALQGVSLKEHPKRKEGWILRDIPNAEGEEEFYFKGQTLVWSKSSSHGVRTHVKSFTLENSVHQALWAEFNICTSKPRRMEPEPEIPENKNKDIMSGICAVESTTVTVFTESGESFIASIPFQISKAWVSKYGLLLERNTAETSRGSRNDSSNPDHIPVIFSMLHPLDDVSPVIKKVSSSGARQLSYFCSATEEIVFTCSSPSLVVTFNKTDGLHMIWRLRTTSFEEAEYACSKAMLESQFGSATPINHSSVYYPSSSNHSKHGLPSQTPSNVCSPFHSLASSRVTTPGASQSHSPSPAVSSLTHMATLSRSCSPSACGSISRFYSAFPLSGNRKSSSPVNANNECEFMDPLAPDLCFEHEWTESNWVGEPASKVFLSLDVTGHKFLCYLLKKHQLLRLVKFEDSNDNSQWIFGTSSVIPALDAEALPSLNLIIVLEFNLTLALYTGLIKVSKVHVAECFGPFPDFPILSNSETSLSATPRRPSVITSTRSSSRVDLLFGEEMQQLSPVASSSDSSPKTITICDDIAVPSLGVYKGLQDAVKNRVTLVSSCGLFRFVVPKVADSPTVLNCLHALRAVLPRDIYTHVFVKWYSTRNAPGSADMTCESELNAFLICVLHLLGYSTEFVRLGGFMNPAVLCSRSAKKLKTDESGIDDDWNYLLNSNYQTCVWKTKEYWISSPSGTSSGKMPSRNQAELNTSAALLPYIAHVLYAIHMVYEDCKVNVLLWNDLCQLCCFLFDLARDLRLDKYMDCYWRDFPKQFSDRSLTPLLSEENLQKIHFPAFFSIFPNIYSWVLHAVEFGDPGRFPYIPEVTDSLRNLVLAYLSIILPDFRLEMAQKYLVKVVNPVSGLRDQDNFLCDMVANFNSYSPDPKKTLVELLTKMKIASDDLNVLPVGLSLIFRYAILNCRHKPLSEWPEKVYSFIERPDLLMLHLTEKGKSCVNISRKNPSESGGRHNCFRDGEDGYQYLDHEVLRLRFSEDLRMQDVCHMLQSSKPIRVVVKQRPEVSDHEFIEEQERHLYSLCIRTMALPIGRGMVTLHSYTPVITETLPIPKLCLTGKAPPRNNVVDLSHIDTPPNMNMWPLFHNGVAAGLRITPDASQIDSTWMVYNKPRSSGSDTPTEHAGFLMALGLSGHLSNLSTLSIHDYLCKGHELTSVGVLLGVSAAMRGSMDVSITKLLSIHIEALLPPTSTELDVPPVVQVAAVMGIGLLYQGSCNHYMAEIMLGEIGRPPGPEMEHCVDRESYALAAGLALGLITFGKGTEASGLADLSMADQLYHYMIGGQKRPLTGVHKEKHKSPSYQIWEGDCINVNVTGPGATLALGMMFFNSNNHAVADWMKAPDTQFLLDMVRPDFLLLRTVSRGLILWSSVFPNRDWVEKNVPEIVMQNAFNQSESNSDIDYETMSQAYCNIIAGSCFCLGLKFAGSANEEAFETLWHYAKFFLSVSGKVAGDRAGKSTVETCLNVTTLALGMVMAGTGDLDVMRLCRHLRTRVGQTSNYVLYGSHVATHMALGLLFLGGGRYTLSTSPQAISAMLCAFYPKYPTHSNDNRYHLQALYHLYVLAAEPRLIVPRNLDSRKPIYAIVRIVIKETEWYNEVEYAVKAPCLLPELKTLKKVVVEDCRYWPIVFEYDKNWEILCKVLQGGGNLFLKQKTLCLPHNEDPKGVCSSMAESSLLNWVHGCGLKKMHIEKFSWDPRAFHFISCFLKDKGDSETESTWQQKVVQELFDCAHHEKMDVLPVYITYRQIAERMIDGFHTLDTLQLKLLSSFHNFIQEPSTDQKYLLKSEFVQPLFFRLERSLYDTSLGARELIFKFLAENWSFETMWGKILPQTLVPFFVYHMIPAGGSSSIAFSEDSCSFADILYQMESMKVSRTGISCLCRLLNVASSDPSKPHEVVSPPFEPMFVQ